MVRWYRRNGETGSVTVQGGTPRGIYTGTINEDVGATNNNAGSDREYIPSGWLILKSDKPISCFSGADGAGSNSTPGWPINQLSQLFPNPATVSDRERLDQSSVSICSPYEGTATVYGSDGVIITTFEITRAVPVSSTNDQLFPAAGQWNPFQTGTTDWTGGWVQTNVPSVAVFNFMDNPIHTLDNGDETLIPGVTPDEIKAEIIQDASGIYRRRDIDASGIETWNIC